KTGKAVELAIGINVFGFDRAALDVTKLAHPAAIFFQQALPLRLRRRYQPADPRGFSGTLLGKGFERCRERGVPSATSRVRRAIMGSIHRLREHRAEREASSDAGPRQRPARGPRVATQPPRRRAA